MTHEQPNPSAYSSDLDLALRLAREADAITIGRYRAGDLRIETKADLTPVTEADQAVERLVRETIARERPGDSVVGEEYGTDEDTGPRKWIVDPIDGTKNYVRGVPVWCTLIALVDGDDVVVGVASAPGLGRTWWASRGAGAWLMDTTPTGSPEPRRLQVSAVSRIGDASMSYSDPVGWEAVTPGGFDRLRTSVWRSRAYGDFWSHLLVAEGAVDIAAEPELSLWDMAALLPIVTEAGGVVSSFSGGRPQDDGNLVTTNGVLHEQALAALAAK